MAIEPVAELPVGDVDELVALSRKDGDRPISGVAPWQLALRRLRRNKVALVFGALFIVIVAMCLAAPLYADHVAHTDAYKNHLTDQIVIDGVETDVVSPDGVPIGPTWGRQVLPRRRRERPRHRGPAAVRRADLAADRLGRRADDDLVVDPRRHPRGLPRRLGRHAHLAHAGHHLVVPGAAARGRARHRVRARRLQARADRDRRRLAAHPADASSGSSTSRTWRGRCAGRCSRCARRSSSRPRARRASGRSGSCSPRSCRTSPRRSSSSSR